MPDSWEEWQAKRRRDERTYFDVDKFIDHFRSDKLIEHFILDEGAFMSLTGMMEADPSLAREVTEAAVILLMRADGGFEIDGVIHMAQVIAEENGG